MHLLTYTNTLKRTGEIITEQVLVTSEKVALELIAKWNRSTTSYHYDFISLTQVSEERYPRLGRWITEHVFEMPPFFTFRG